ncbi:MAG: zinc-binding dehydrogenase [Pseudomonas sp.]|nr:zinc-binding dehydrogenase [Pseudomonas sp.]
MRDLIGGETQLRSWKELFDAGQLSVEVEVFPISQVKQAVEKGRAGHTRGKIVLNLRQ